MKITSKSVDSACCRKVCATSLVLAMLLDERSTVQAATEDESCHGVHHAVGKPAQTAFSIKLKNIASIS